MNIKHVISATILLATAVVLPASNAAADDSVNCEAYAMEAYKDAKEAATLGCGFNDTLWSLDFHGHKNWCKQGSINMANLTWADRARKEGLQQCKDTKEKAKYRPANAPTEQNCHSYAKQMVSHAKTNQTRQCGYTTGRFANDYQGHFNWCFDGKPKSQVAAALDKTSDMIKQCGAQNAKKSKTEKFAHSGVYNKRIRKYLPLDHCSEKLYDDGKKTDLYGYCGKPNADRFCKSQGYAEAIDFPMKTYNNGSDMDGDFPSTWWMSNKKPCHGNCKGFSSITCQGAL